MSEYVQFVENVEVLLSGYAPVAEGIFVHLHPTPTPLQISES